MALALFTPLSPGEKYSWEGEGERERERVKTKKETGDTTTGRVDVYPIASKSRNGGKSEIPLFPFSFPPLKV